MPLRPAGAAAHRRQPRHVRRRARLRRTRRSPTPPIWAAATTTRAAASPSTASGACSPPAPRPIRRPAALGASDAFIYGISSGLAGVDTDGDGLDDDWETQFGTDPNTNDAAARSGRRRLHQRPGARQQHASDRLLHPLPGRRIDRRVLRRSHRAVQSRARHRHRGAALPARRRRRDPAGPRRSRRAAAPRSTPKRSSASRTRRSRPSSRATSRWSSTAR